MSTKHKAALLEAAAANGGSLNTVEASRAIGISGRPAQCAMDILVREGSFKRDPDDKRYYLADSGTATGEAAKDEKPLTKSERAELSELRVLFDFYRQATEAMPVEVPEWRKTWSGIAGARHSAIVVSQLTDTHFDEVILPEEVLGYNAYNREIAELRFERWVDHTVVLPQRYFAGVDFEGLLIPATGDILSGDIHAELKESNEDKLLSSLLYWSNKLVSALEALEGEYPWVEVDAVVGNHGRTTMKPVFKGRAKSNVEWLLWHVVKARLADRGSKVTINVSDSMDMIVPVYGRNHVLTHGDKFHGGSGISGALAPLMLGSHRMGVRQLAMGEPMTTLVMGHFHQTLDLPGVIVGGSLKGYDEFAFGLSLRPEPAAQMLWLTTPERGKTMTMPIIVQDRKREGW